MAGEWQHDGPTVRAALERLRAGQAGEVYRWLSQGSPERAQGPALVFLKDVFLLLSQQQAHDAILAAAAVAPAEQLFSLIPTYYAGCVLLARGHCDQGFALLNRFRRRCLDNLAALPSDDTEGFMVLFRQALLVNDGSYLRSPYFHQELARNQARLGPLQGLEEETPPPAGDQSPVILVSCDQGYADLFLAPFLASVERHCRGRVVHVHLLDPAPVAASPHPDPPPQAGEGELPTALAAASLPRLRGRTGGGTDPRPSLPPLVHNHLRLTWEESGALKSSAWYASARFVRIGTLLRHYRRPILAFDVDLELTEPPERLEAAWAGADFAAFQAAGRIDPASLWQAGVTAFRPSPAGLALADLTGRLILSRLSLQPQLLWLVDQAALYSAIHLLTAPGGGLRTVDLTRALGLELPGYLKLAHAPEDKARLMLRASGVEEG